MTPNATAGRTIHFIVPAYNEAENLPFLFENLRGFARFSGERCRIVLIDDGSQDATFERALELAEHSPELRLDVLHHEVNRGPGVAFDAGFRFVAAKAADDDVVVTIEADNTSDVLIVSRMIDRLARGADVVLASVYGHGRIAGAPLQRRLLSWFANALVKARFELWGLHTFSSFFRVYRAPVLRRAFDAYGDHLMREPGFACMVELLVKLDRMGLAIEEVPMLLDARVRRGVSKMKIVRTALTYLRLLRGIERPTPRIAMRVPSPSVPTSPPRTLTARAPCRESATL